VITENDLQEAIAECEGQRNPTANTCIKLAAFYTIREHLFGRKDDPPVRYSYLPAPEQIPQTAVAYEGDTEFSQAIAGRDPAEIWAIMDELMSTLQIVNPRLYAGVMRKIAE